MGMPCKKYSKTSNRKLRLSCSGRSVKPLDAASVGVVGGGALSRVKELLLMRLAVMVAESGDSSEACLRRCSSRFPDMLCSSAVEEADEGAEPVALLGLLDAPLTFLGIGVGECASEMSTGREW
jgi:hypothetical protein